MINTDQTTEEKIKRAASELFQEKGYSATKTRDIAERAQINLALLNYYFRSKSRLFEIIMMENLQDFLGGLGKYINDPKTSLIEKLHQIVNSYIDMLMHQPNLPIFVLGEIRNNPDLLVKKAGIDSIFRQSLFLKQLQDHLKNNFGSEISPVHFIMNIMSMTVFPFVAQPIFSGAMGIQKEEFQKIMLQRKQLIPFWIETMLNTDHSMINHET